jgi:hypothetical protein
VDDPPPPELVHGDVRGVEHAGQIQAEQGQQVEDQDAADAGIAALGEGRGDVVEEGQHRDHDADVRPARRLDVLPALHDEPDGLHVRRADLDQQVDQHDHDHGRGEYPEDQVTQT